MKRRSSKQQEGQVRTKPEQRGGEPEATQQATAYLVDRIPERKLTDDPAVHRADCLSESGCLLE